MSSRMDKNLKAKKTTKSMNPKTANTMKHVDLLSKSSDVNFKKGLTRSGTSGSEDMDVVDENGIQMDVSKEVTGEGMHSEDGLDAVKLKEGAGKSNSTDEVRLDMNSDDNVSDMFPELNNVYGSKKSNVSSVGSSVLPNSHVPGSTSVGLKSDVGIRNDIDNNKVVEGNVIGDNSGANKNEGNGQSMQVDSDNVGVQSSIVNDGMKVNDNTRKPVSFSNVV